MDQLRRCVDKLKQAELSHVHDVEILAPAGSLDICKAVIRAGADAVYLGGDMFGARAYATNLSRDEMLEAIEYAHRFGRRIYLTVNTLLKDSEIENMLIDYIRPFYIAGLDAVIVQDLGVLKVMREHFPKLSIHASTQMTQTGYMGAKLLMNAGVNRVVTSREMTLDEITLLHRKLPELEIESFVHGALCYCYSGQCLLSSFSGGRSGNRGQCAQPCRLPYDIISDSKSGDKSRQYLLSPKDMCTLSILPDIIEAGVYSLKIEGRMKNVTYAAYVTYIYRKYVDMYLKCKCNNNLQAYHVSQADIDALMDVYNRGGFTTGYYDTNPGRSMISLDRPNHYGTKALKVISNNSGNVTFEVLRDINVGDVFEVTSDYSFTSGKDCCKGEKLVVNLSRKLPLNKGRELFRMKNAKLARFVDEKFCYDDSTSRNDSELRNMLDVTVTAVKGEPLTATAQLSAIGKRYVSDDSLYGTGRKTTSTESDDSLYRIGRETTSTEGDDSLYGTGRKTASTEEIDNIENVYAMVAGDIVEEAQKAPISRDDIIKAFVKTGNPFYGVADIDIVLDEDVFVPASSLKNLRRRLIELVDKKILSRYIRSDEAYPEHEKCPNSEHVNTKHADAEYEDSEHVKLTDDSEELVNDNPYISVHIHSSVCLEIACKNPRVRRIYIEYTAILDDAELAKICRILKSNSKSFSDNVCYDKELYIALPHIIREDNKPLFRALIGKSLSLNPTGFVVRSLEQIGWLHDKMKYSSKIITDANLYVMNSQAMLELERIVTEAGMQLEAVTISQELNSKEQQELISRKQQELISKERQELVSMERQELNSRKQQEPNPMERQELVSMERQELISKEHQESKHMNNIDIEVPIYNYIPMMVSRQCVRKTIGKCNKCNDRIIIKSGNKDPLVVQSMCDFCYTVTYKAEHACGQVSISKLEQAKHSYNDQSMSNISFRYEFIDETEEEIQRILARLP